MLLLNLQQLMISYHSLDGFGPSFRVSPFFIFRIFEFFPFLNFLNFWIFLLVKKVFTFLHFVLCFMIFAMFHLFIYFPSAFYPHVYIYGKNMKSCILSCVSLWAFSVKFLSLVRFQVNVSTKVSSFLSSVGVQVTFLGKRRKIEKIKKMQKMKR